MYQKWKVSPTAASINSLEYSQSFFFFSFLMQFCQALMTVFTNHTKFELDWITRVLPMNIQLYIYSTNVWHCCDLEMWSRSPKWHEQAKLSENKHYHHANIYQIINTYTSTKVIVFKLCLTQPDGYRQQYAIHYTDSFFSPLSFLTPSQLHRLYQ